MTVPEPDLSPEAVRGQLSRLRQGPALGHPGAVTGLSGQLRALLLERQPPIAAAASETTRLLAALRQAIDGLTPHERRYAVADFNLVPEHSWPTLTERQESLARVLGCSAKTVRRHASQALDTLALLVCDGSYLTAPAGAAAGDMTVRPGAEGRFFGIGAGTAGVHVVCSALSGDAGRQRRGDPLFSRYAGFADLDALVYVRVRLAQAFPGAVIRDFYPGEYYSSDPDSMIVLGTPERNSVYAEFLPHLPYRFDPFPDAAVAFPGHGVRLSPQWAPEGELLADVSVITRLTLAQGTIVVLLGGCLGLGVLGAAKCLLSAGHGQRNTAYLASAAPDGDIIAVTVTRKISSITDAPDLTVTEPLLVLARDRAGAFTVRLDNTARYLNE